MQRVVPAVLSAMVASLGFAGTAQAADVPQGYMIPAPSASLYNWTGFYVGGQGGYSWGTFNVDPRGADIDGWFAGGQIGFNWQNGRSPWVFGIEVDSAFGNIERDVDRITVTTFASAYSKVNYFGTARVRVGYAIDRAMIYGTGGLAWAHSEIGLYADWRQLGAYATSDNSHIGYAAGAGFEWALSRSWTMKVEYLYTGFGAENYLAGTVPGGINADLGFSTGRLGVNYIFDWGRPFVGPKY